MRSDDEPEAGTGLRGLRVAALESRRAEELRHLIERFGGVPSVSPSLREVPIERSPEALDFAHRVLTGEIGVAVFLTGSGFRFLLTALERHLPIQRFLDGLSDIVTIARGPKPAAALREAGIDCTHRVPPPNTWRDLLTLIDHEVPIAGQTIGLLEYGVRNPSLVAGLEARGARVVRVPVYRWEFPENVEPLRENVAKMAAGQIDVLLCTSAHQIVNLFRAADEAGLADLLRRGLRHTVIGSIGPTTSETLREFDLPVDFEPEHGKMGHLVRAAAERAWDIWHGKRSDVQPVAPSEPRSEPRPLWEDGPFMKACRREPTEVTPIWLMRQAGRYMPEYRRIRARTSFLGLCKDPSACSEVMCTAVRILGVDAAILFSDLLPILEPIGFDLEFAPGEGPAIHNPVRSGADIDRLRELESMDPLNFVRDAVRFTRNDLPSHIPLIGFAGAPFTLASYAIEGGSSRSFAHTKRLMHEDDGAWRALMGILARAVARYLAAQIAAGAQCVQLFDSWVGCLGPADYARYALPYVRAIVECLPATTPVIYFGAGNPELLPAMATTGAPILGVDWRVELDDAWRRIGHDRCIQGNLDPGVLMGTWRTITDRVQDVLEKAGRRPGHIFNLGHGILPQTPVENVTALVNSVHAWR
ncbi:MAG: uroporphyrinogen decarboxylase [Planctomycetes bacterium]|nr:uroporphyrinogen decarboxylase [Planctomycetota bacterium]